MQLTYPFMSGAKARPLAVPSNSPDVVVPASPAMPASRGGPAGRRNPHAPVKPGKGIFAGIISVLLGSLAMWAPPAAALDNFRELTVRLAHPVDTDPISVRLEDGPGLLAVGRFEGATRYSLISLVDGSVVLQGDMPETVFFYDVGDPAGRGSESLSLFDEQGIAVVDPATGSIDRVAEFSSIYHGRPSQGPTPSDFVRDVDGEAGDELLVPVFDGWLLAKRRGEEFHTYRLEIDPRVSAYAARVSYEPRRPRIGDANGDGRNDLVFLRDTAFVSFVQEADGSFASVGRRDPIDAPLASEEDRARWERDDGQVDQSELQIEEVELIRDFDGDGILDLLTDRSISEGVFDRSSEYHLYLGRRNGGSLEYPRVPDGSIASGGIQFDPLAVDVDGDGRLDLATPSTQLGLGRVISALVTGRITVDLDVYRMRANGVYREESDYQTRFKVEFDLTTGQMRYPAIKIADFDGDGPADLLLQGDDDVLELYPGTGDDNLFGKQQLQSLELPLPSNGQMVEARDLDDDGRADLLVRYGLADGPKRQGELRIFLSAIEG